MGGASTAPAALARVRSAPLRLLTLLANRPKWLAWAIAVDVAVCGLLFAVFEGTGPITALWWAIVTGSTTGYGDFFPKTTPGRGIAAVLMVSMWVLDRLASAQFVARLIADPECFTHDEQEEVMGDVEETRARTERMEASLARLEQTVAALASHLDVPVPPAPLTGPAQP